MTRPTVEILEARIAPANLLDPHTIVFTDTDGDEVKIVFSKDVFTGTDDAQLAKANEVFTFDTGDVAHEVLTQQQLQLIDFTQLGSLANGVGLTVTATAQNGGNGFVDVGAIKAVGVSLGKIVIDGDLGQIDAGGSGLKIGLAALTVKSLGQRGVATQMPVPAPDLVSTITGELTALVVLDDVKEARVKIVNGFNSQNQLTTLAKLGSLTIGGSLLGRTAVEAASDNTGLIECARDIGAILIGTDAMDGIVGGGGSNSGRITAGGPIASLAISGNLQGGAGSDSGSVWSTGSIGIVSIGGDLVGGAGATSGRLQASGNLASLTVDDLLAGTGADSGSVQVLGSIKKVIVHDLDGTTINSGARSAGIFANGISQATINGGVFGGAGAKSGFLESGRILGATSLTGVVTGVTVVGNVVGGAGDESGSVFAHGAAKLLTLKGNLLGGIGKQSGTLRSGTDTAQNGDMNAVSVGGKVEGGAGENSGRISAQGKLVSVKITGDLKGAGGSSSGTIFSGNSMGVANIGGDIIGGTGEFSGRLLTYGNLASLVVGDDLIAGKGAFSGSVYALGAIAKTLVKGDLNGTDIVNADTTTSPSGANSASIFANGLPQLIVNGSVFGGTGAQSGSIESGRSLGASTLSADGVTTVTGATILGNVIGGVGDGSGSIIAHGSAKLLAVKGNLTGGSGQHSGLLRSGSDFLQNGDMLTVSVAGKIEGGGGDNSGAIISGGSLLSATIGNLTTASVDVLKGGDGDFSGAISAQGRLGTVKITGNVLGGAGAQSGALLSYERAGVVGNIGTVNISGHFTGGAGDDSGLIHADGALGKLTVGAFEGGTGPGSGSLDTGDGLLGTGNVTSIRILGNLMQAEVNPGVDSATLVIGGKLTALSVTGNTNGAAIHVGNDAATLAFSGNVTDTTITARGQATQGATTDLALGALTIRGNVSGSSFFAGYSLLGDAVNPDAQIGSVNVIGNWTASNLVAGADSGTDAFFGDDNDMKAAGPDAAGIVSKIASVIIGGSVSGSGTAGETFGFVAQFVAKLKVGTTIFALNALADTQFIPVGGASSGVAIVEVPLV